MYGAGLRVAEGPAEAGPGRGGELDAPSPVVAKEMASSPRPQGLGSGNLLAPGRAGGCLIMLYGWEVGFLSPPVSVAERPGICFGGVVTRGLVVGASL